MKGKDNKLLYIGGGAGLIAALCCIGPVVLILFGLGSVSAALTIGKFAWLFSILAILFFTTGVFIYLKKKNCCNTQGWKQHWKTILTAFILMVLLLLLLKYVIAPAIATVAYR